ncbi:unnamed protein product [Polarella glacialis]|uniref:Uncharacterized protein n=1 Tax=Polarella glacialis TaxID=89957 RepID=A0A813JHU0_POLGL|nr:unnamed protein product [Polarella glacialis]
MPLSLVSSRQDQGVAEVVHAELLETDTGQGAKVMDALEERVDHSGGLAAVLALEVLQEKSTTHQGEHCRQCTSARRYLPMSSSGPREGADKRTNQNKKG